MTQSGAGGPYSETQVLERARWGYRHGRADFDVRPERCALLVIDMQNEFVRPGWSPYWIPAATAIVPRARELIAQCRERAVPVIFTVFAETHHRLDRPRALRHMPNVHPDWQPPPEAAEVWPELAPIGDEIVIAKASYGAFFDTPLDTILRGLGRDTIILTGTLTNFCVGMTARQGYERGYYVVVAEDATGTDVPEQHDAELATLRKGFALVAPVSEIAERLAVPDR